MRYFYTLAIFTLLFVGCGSRTENADSAANDTGAVRAANVAPSDEERELTVFAAASLRESLEEIGALYTERTKTEMVFNFAGSNELARQIVAGPGADLFLSAAENWMDTVERAQRIVPGSRLDLLSNSLVVVGHAAAALAIDQPCALARLDFRSLAIGDPESVPAGRYAKMWLESVDCGGSSLWDAVEKKVAPSIDVRAALGVVMADPAFIGIVYRTDQRAHAGRTKVLFEVTNGPPIRYVLARIADGAAPEDARMFAELLNGAEGRRIFEKHGFTFTSAVATQ
jgi:molybdate transport system substrate-binding protein